MIYTKPIEGKCGIKNMKINAFAFNICCDTEQECLKLLKQYSGEFFKTIQYKFAVWTKKDVAKYSK